MMRNIPMMKGSVLQNIPRIRAVVQCGFLFFTLFIGWRFYLFFLWAMGESAVHVPRPPAVEGFLPIGALVGLKRLLATGSYDMVHPAGLTIFLAAIAVAFIARKGFCGWICPVGAVSNLAERTGRRLKIMRETPRILDIGLSSIKYLLLFFFVAIIFFRMSPEAVVSFHGSTYNVVADAKMLLFFLVPSLLAGGVTLFLFLLSFVVVNPWCRWFCPYGALLGVVALVSPVRVVRDEHVCIKCQKCDRSCPATIPVSTRKAVRDNGCVGCMACVSACPVPGCLKAKVAHRSVHPLAIVAAGLLLFFIFWIWARSSGHWVTEIPDHLFQELYPKLRSFGHPSY